MAQLQGYALVFGAGSGIGRETAYTFAEHGASGVAFADINEDTARESAEFSKTLATTTSYRTLVLKVDVSDRSSVQAGVASAIKEFGRVDFAVNSAGVGAVSDNTMIETTEDDFERLHSVNGRGTLNVTAEVTQVMLKQEERFTEGRNGRRSLGRGSLVNVSSLNAQLGLPSRLQYGASKFTALSVTLTSAVELARKGVRVKYVLPSWVDTNNMRTILKRVPQWDDMIKAGSPAGRMALPEEVAEVIHFLCTPGASYMHGSGVVIDAGVSVTRGFA